MAVPQQWLLKSTYDEEICLKLRCWDSTEKKCVIKLEQRAHEKTSCGNRKWCIRGQCVDDPDASSVPGMHIAIAELFQAHVYQVRFGRFRQNIAWWHTSALGTIPPVEFPILSRDTMGATKILLLPETNVGGVKIALSNFQGQYLGNGKS